MLTAAQEKLIKSLHTKKGRKESGLCLIEGEKNIKEAGDYIEYTFTQDDSKHFDKLVTTETPQKIAAVAKIPEYGIDDIQKKNTIIVLDYVQDPGNVGTILRLCHAFDASLIFIESADPSSPKVLRSSVGSFFHVPFLKVSREAASKTINELNRPIYRLEKTDTAKKLSETHFEKEKIFIAGSEGKGIELDIDGISVMIEHSSSLESLNVASSLAITLYQTYL